MKIEKIAVKNFKTLENIDVEINPYYTAICGKNNAGKTNLLQCITAVLGDYGNLYSNIYEDKVIKHKDHFTIWKNDKTEPIEIYISLKLFKDYDSLIIKFVTTFAQKDSNGFDSFTENADHILTIKIVYHPDNSNPKIEVTINGVLLEEYSAQEVLSKIQNSKALLFHNSTETSNRYSRYHGFFDGFSASERSAIDSKREILLREFKKISESHKKDLTELMGRLSDKYELNLTVPGFSFDRIPYGISLGDKEFGVPLDSWGSGTKNRTLILKSLFDAKKSLARSDELSRLAPIILIEEPESFLHPSAQAEFGKVLQDLAVEFNIQIITTTHSPFILSSFEELSSNILLERNSVKKRLRETIKVNTSGLDWKKPFALALGIEGPEFDNIKNVFFSQSNALLLVEGDTDKEYFELLRSDVHGKNKLDFDGQIYSYNGCGTLNNTVMLKFIKEKYSKVIITFDLDAYNSVRSSLNSLRLEEDKDYFKIGIDKGGKRCIEGLLPTSVFNVVWGNNIDLVQQITSDNKSEVEDAKKKIKRLYLEEFKSKAQPGNEYYKEFYEVVRKINKAFKEKS